MPRRIDPTTIYDGVEIKKILKGFTKLETLRAFGLIGSAGGGYWGGNVIDSINNYWKHLERQRIGTTNFDDPMSPSHSSIGILNHDQMSDPDSRNDKPRESQRRRFRRLIEKKSQKKT